MPDSIPAVGAQIQPPNPMGPMNAWSAMLGMQQQQTGIQQQQAELQTQRAQAQQAQQKNTELQGLAGFAKAAMNQQSPYWQNGKFDYDSYRRDATAVAPVYGADTIDKHISSIKNVLDTQRTFQNMGTEANTAIGNMMTGFATKQGPITDADIDNLADNARSTIGNNSDAQYRIGTLIGHLRAAKTEQERRQIAQNGASLVGGFSQQKPATIDSGGAIQPGATNTFSGGFTPAGGSIGKTPAPVLVTNPSTGGPAFAGGAYGSNPHPIQPAGPLGSGGAAASGSGGWQPPQGQQGIMQNIEAARTAGDQGGAARNVNAQLLKLSAGTDTGPGTKAWHTALGAIGAPFGASPSGDYQEIGAYLDRQAAYQAQVMGVPNTNAGMAASERAAGTTEYSPKALQEKVKFADALNSGAMAFRKGLDKAVGTGATPDLSKYQAYRSAWAQNFDPDVFRAEDAQRRGDKAELSAIRTRVGPDGMKALAQKSANLRTLENGQIPQ